MLFLGWVDSILTSFFGGKFHSVAGLTLKAIVGHNHEHLVVRVGNQVTEHARWFDRSAIETFNLLLLTDHQTWNLTRLPPVV